VDWRAKKEVAARGNAPDFTFALVSDIQYADRDDIPKYNMYYRAALDKLEYAVSRFNAEKIEFAAQLGDFVDCKFESYDEVYKRWNKITARKVMVLGNHEFLDGQVPADEIVKKAGLEKRYYDFSCGRWRFIVLDSCDVGVYSNPPGSEKRILAQKMLAALEAKKAPNGYVWNSAISDEQIQWLDATIADAEKSHQKVIIFMHHPLVPEVVWNAGDVLAVLEKRGNVVCVFAGHTHEAGYEKRNGIYHCVLAGLVTDPEQIHYTFADVYDDRIELRGAGCNFSPVLRF
jgi:3',5'-cyclic AMP phosphodiesterase CpdA